MGPIPTEHDLDTLHNLWQLDVTDMPDHNASPGTLRIGDHKLAAVNFETFAPARRTYQHPGTGTTETYIEPAVSCFERPLENGLVLRVSLQMDVRYQQPYAELWAWHPTISGHHHPALAGHPDYVCGGMSAFWAAPHNNDRRGGNLDDFVTALNTISRTLSTLDPTQLHDEPIRTNAPTTRTGQPT